MAIRTKLQFQSLQKVAAKFAEQPEFDWIGRIPKGCILGDIRRFNAWPAYLP
ncbi:MAG: hypothetical protein ABJP48_02445 [Erythrobacter sp.]